VELSEAPQILSLLPAEGPDTAYERQLMQFGRLVGDWDFTGVEHHPDGSEVTDEGEIQIGWVLGGRAILDVWKERKRSDDAPLVHGTTIRHYDPTIDAWRAVWIEPRLGTRSFIGRVSGDDIVFEGTGSDGRPIRWMFTEITARTFHWLGQRQEADAGWRTYEELWATLKPAPPG
jgi:hypothetical protein